MASKSQGFEYVCPGAYTRVKDNLHFCGLYISSDWVLLSKVFSYCLQQHLQSQGAPLDFLRLHRLASQHG